MPKKPENKSKKLTHKQERFCQEYMIDLNATQAAIRAGYSKKTAKTIAGQNLSKLIIAEKIAELKKAIGKSTELTIAKVVGAYEKIAFGAIGNNLNNSHRLKALEALGRHKGVFEEDNKQKRMTLADIAALAGAHGND